jgi:hypothetical protein
VTDEDSYHVCTGRPMLPTGEPDLADDAALWREVWTHARAELLARWIARHPGSRPRAFWEHDAKGIAHLDDESEVACLHRHHLLSSEELGAIRERAQELARYDRDRDPARPGDNFIRAGDIEAFAAAAGLLSAEERAVLCPDEDGRHAPSR